ncbi:protein of unknown function [Sterolibacterium denitrificans]|uniref:Uncharacterized protein n=1 Tax=Sterolibacterium denitrificans TaxID=157592 RepID=A0A7Z7HNU8_9PROT|nr:protein of unknown function [Sterolibacterium denitrificans]
MRHAADENKGYPFQAAEVITINPWKAAP